MPRRLALHAALLGLLAERGNAVACEQVIEERKLGTFDWHGEKEPAYRERTMQESAHDHSCHRDPKFITHPERSSDADSRRLMVEDEQDLLQTLWDRPGWRNKRFSLTSSWGESPCFDGFKTMTEWTDRCDGFVREYPPVGSQVPFWNPNVREPRNFTLNAVVAGNINVWAGPKATQSQIDTAVKAANIYANTYALPELRPVPESNSWMDHECKVFGSMPFMYTCSNRINVLLLECGFENAFVMSGDYLRNFPGPATNESVSNHDIVFYMCMMLLDKDPNPYAAANTFAHELAHVIQGGFGHTFNTMTEGGATWLEGALLHLPPRPMVYAWGFRDWNRINAAHFYANTKEMNARKFYQIHAMFLTYLMQDELLGNAYTSALQNYATFDYRNQPWGRGAYDYFLAQMGKEPPSEFQTVDLKIDSTDFPFAEALLNYRVAIVTACIKDPMLRPTEAKYLLPPQMRDRPYWDCTSYPTFWSSEFGLSVTNASAEMHYGGAAVFRLAMPQGATVSIAEDADPQVRTKVVAAGDGHLAGAEVHELKPGESVTLGGSAREVFIVQVNVDPKGEMISSDEIQPLWRRFTVDNATTWMMAGEGEGEYYPPGVVQGLLSPLIKLPDKGAVTLDFTAWWDMEAESVDGSTVANNCSSKGYDGVQVRVHTFQDASGDVNEQSDGIAVVRPVAGYGAGPGGEAALHAFQSEGVYDFSAPCSFFEGWTGKSDGETTQQVSLDFFASKKVRLEFLFVSDGSASGKGFRLRNMSVSGPDGFSRVLHDSMTVRAYVQAPPPAGTKGEITGVPVVASYPDKFAPDRALMKNEVTRKAPWSAKWNQFPRDPLATLRRSYLGWSYSAPTTDTRTAFLHPQQEACMLVKAPFAGYPQTATLFTLVDKIGIGSVSLAPRAPKAPYPILPGYEMLLSQSPEVEDLGIHRFDFMGTSIPPLSQGTPFLLCAGIGHLRPLIADGDLEPFVHLALTEVESAGDEGEAGATFLLTPANASSSGLDPWKGHSITLRIEFVEAPHINSVNLKETQEAYAEQPIEQLGNSEAQGSSISDVIKVASMGLMGALVVALPFLAVRARGVVRMTRQAEVPQAPSMWQQNTMDLVAGEEDAEVATTARPRQGVGEPLLA